MKLGRPRLWHDEPFRNIWAAARGKKLIPKKKRDTGNKDEKQQYIEVPSIHKDERNDRIEASLDATVVGGNHFVSMTMAAFVLVGLTTGISELGFTTLAIYGALTNLTQSFFRLVGGYYERSQARNKNLNKFSKTLRQFLLVPAYIIATVVAFVPSLITNIVFAASLPLLAFTASVINVGFGLSHTFFQATMWYKTPKTKPYAVERRRTQTIKRAAQTVGAILTTVVLGVVAFGLYTVASPAYFPLAITAGVVNTMVFAYSGLREAFPTFFRGRRTFARELLEPPEVKTTKTENKPNNQSNFVAGVVNTMASTYSMLRGILIINSEAEERVHNRFHLGALISEHQQNLRNEPLDLKKVRYEKEYTYIDKGVSKAKGEEGYHHHLDLIAEIQGIENNESLNEKGLKPTPEEKITAIDDYIQLLLDSKKQAILDGLEKRNSINDGGSLWQRMSKKVRHAFGITGARKKQQNKLFLLAQMPHLIDNSKDADTKLHHDKENPFKDLHYFTAPEIVLVNNDDTFKERCTKGAVNPRTLYVFKDVDNDEKLKYVYLNEDKKEINDPLVTDAYLTLSPEITKEINRCFEENIADADGMARLSEQSHIDEILKQAYTNKHVKQDNLETCFENDVKLEESVFRAYYNKFSEMETLIRAFRQAARPAIDRLRKEDKEQKMAQEQKTMAANDSNHAEKRDPFSSNNSCNNSISRNDSFESVNSQKTMVGGTIFPDSNSNDGTPISSTHVSFQGPFSKVPSKSSNGTNPNLLLANNEKDTMALKTAKAIKNDTKTLIVAANYNN